MRYMMMVKGDVDRDRSMVPPPALLQAIDAMMEEQTKAGKLVSFGGLTGTEDGARVRAKGGQLVKTDGPFTESKEVIGGFTILKLASRDEAVAEALRFMKLHLELWPEWEGEVEIRRMYDEENPPEWDVGAGTKDA